MTGHRVLIHSLFLLLLPVIVACYEFSTFTAIVLVLLALLWRWGISLSAIMFPADVPELELETISASHFVEKVRWCMDRLGIEYTERPVAGTLGVFFTGRTVPQLKIRTGATRSVIGNSPEILRYLWGRYANDGNADFLEPNEARLALEKRIDRYGVDLQVWVYYHLLNDRELTLHAWGVHNPRLPLWQRYTLKVLFPVLRALIRRAFNINDKHYQKAVTHIESLLSDINDQLSDDRHAILGTGNIDYVDISFAAISGLWIQPDNYGAGQADSVRLDKSKMPAAMSADIDRWSTKFPIAYRHVINLYQQQRLQHP